MASRRFAGIGALTSLALSSLALADSTLTLDIGPMIPTSANETRLSGRPERLAIAIQRDSKTAFADESIDIDFSGYVLGDAGNDAQAAADRLGLLPIMAFDAASGRAPQSIVVDASARPIVTGVSTQANGALQAYIARFTTSGALDTSFGAGTGLFFAPLTQPVFGNVPACKIAITSGDKLVLACIVDNGVDAQGYAVPQLTITGLNADGTLDRSFGAAQDHSDVYPDAFAFDMSSVRANTAATEQPNTLTISGIKGPASVHLYSAAADRSGDGNRANTLDLPIRIPDSFNFTSQNGVPLATLITSNTVTITGLSGSAVVTVSGGEYSIGCTQTFTSAPGPISEGSQLCVRLMSSATNGLPTIMNLTVTVTVGTATASTSSSFTVTTLGTDTQSSSSSGGGGALDRWSLLGLAVLGAMGVPLRRRPRNASGRRAITRASRSYRTRTRTGTTAGTARSPSSKIPASTEALWSASPTCAESTFAHK
jgi:hypothetical protein